jgi:hypothetical protein
MKLRTLIIPATLSLAVLGAAVAPATAAPRDRRAADLYRGAGVFDYNRSDSRYDYSDRYDRRDRRYNDRDSDGLIRRADQVRREANRLYESGRLSRDHRDRTIDKLDRVYSSGRGVSGSRHRADMEWIEDVRETMHEWSRADSGRRYRR